MTKPAYDRWYKLARWQRMRAAQLAQQPLCVMCLEDEIVEPAEVVDHKIPHKGNAALMWDADNLQSLCKRHHDSDKQRDERGPDRGCDVNGLPRDARGDWAT